MPSRKFNILIIGAGNIGACFDTPTSDEVLTHAHAFSKHRGFKLVGFVDSDRSACRRAAALWGGWAFRDMREAFDTQTIDVVVNATPDDRHYSTLKEILKFPVSLILTEKPLTKTVKEATEIVRLAKAKKVKLVTNYSRRFVPEFKKIAEDIQSGHYGEYLTGTGYYGKGIKHNGSHLLDILLYFFGEIKRADIIDRDYDFTADDPSVSAVLKFGDKKPFFLQHINQNLYTIFEMDLCFEKARIRIIDSGFKIEIQRIKKDKIFKGYRKMVVRSIKNTGLNGALYYAADDIYQYLIARKSPVPSLDDGYKTMVAAAGLLVHKHA